MTNGFTKSDRLSSVSCRLSSSLFFSASFVQFPGFSQGRLSIFNLSFFSPRVVYPFPLFPLVVCPVPLSFNVSCIHFPYFPRVVYSVPLLIFRCVVHPVPVLISSHVVHPVPVLMFPSVVHPFPLLMFPRVVYSVPPFSPVVEYCGCRN